MADQPGRPHSQQSAGVPATDPPVTGTQVLGGGSGSAATSTESPWGTWGLPLAVLVVGMFMSTLDISIVNVAIPTIQNEFGASTDDVQWVVTAYTLVLGVVVPASAWLGDRFGFSRLYNLSLLGFAAGSALCGLAWDLHSLVAFRIVQAIPGGVLPVITLSMLYRIVPQQRLGTGMGLYGLGVVVAPAVGPTLGGYLVEYVNWRLIFFINVPIGVLGMVAAALVLPRFPRLADRRFDLLGFLTVAGGLFALLLALSEGQSWGWSSYPILGLLTFSALSLALFVVIELEVADPLLDVRIFRYWPFTNSLLLIIVMSVVMFSVVFYVPLFLQQAQGWGALDAGLTMLPPALAMSLLMPISGRVYDRIGPRWPAVIGLSTVAISQYLLHTITLDISREHLMWLLVVQGAGLGIGMMPIFTSGLAVLPPNRVNAGSAFNNVVQRIAGALGIAVLTAVWTRQQTLHMAGRAALLPATTATPHIGGPGVPDWVGVYATYWLTQLQVFVAGLDDLFLITCGLGILGVVGALFLRSGPSPDAPTGFNPSRQVATRPRSADGAVTDKREFKPATHTIPADNANPAQLTGPVDDESSLAHIDPGGQG